MADGTVTQADVVNTADRRVAALDGVRGLMTIAVVISHFFGEVAHGVKAAMFGWIAVDMFYVLSGFLIARLILDKGKHQNFYRVFYLRRICRTFPIYFICMLIIYGLNLGFPIADSLSGDRFPLWTYATFTQNFYMVHAGNIGIHWLSPTWTLALEEQFYLFAPFVMLALPRRLLVPVLVAFMASAIAFRFYFLAINPAYGMAAFVTLPARLDVLLAGVLGAVLLRVKGVAWSRFDQSLRIAPVVLMVTCFVIKATSPDGSQLTELLTPFLVSVGCAALLMSLVRGAPEAARYHAPLLQFFCQISYAVYLTHLTVLGLLHRVILGASPDVATLPQVAVTLAAIPATVAVSWVLTKLVEEPITSFGRSFRWSAALDPRRAGQPEITLHSNSAIARLVGQQA